MLENIDIDYILNAYALLSFPFGWNFITKLQRNFIIFASISDYFFFKFVLAMVTGGFVVPFYLLGFIYKILFKKKNKVVSIR